MSEKTILKNTVISIHYTVTETTGELIDSSEGQEPLSFLVGHGNIIKGLEEAVINKKVGESFDITLTPEDAYGPIQADAIQSIPLAAFSDVEDLEVGMRFHLQTEQGPTPVTVTHIEDGEVTIDPHHPLAGKTLHFIGKVITIREATKEELEHGHAH